MTTRRSLPGSFVVLFVGLAVLLSGCDWAMFRFGAARTGASSDSGISKDAVQGSMVLDWTASTGNAVISSPAVVNGVVYVGSNDDHLYAFDATGTTGCSGSPKTCAPLWSGAAGRAVSSSPAVANGVVYVGSDDGKLYVFDAAGKTNCSGTPKTCTPLWTATTGARIFSSPVVSGGDVYVGSEDHGLYVFDAAGKTNCSGAPKTCSPLWTGATGGAIDSSPAIANGFVYLESNDGFLNVFDAAGTNNCSGSPKVCDPVWGAFFGVTSLPTTPTVANGIVYVANADLYAFDATGKNCNPLCTPLWSAHTDDLFSSPAVANGVVYAGGSDGTFYAFAATQNAPCPGANNSGCAPLWTASTGVIDSSPAVVNGVVYFGSQDHNLYAFDANGTTNCSGTPTTCTPLWTATAGDAVVSSPAIVNGMVYVGSSDHKLYAYGLEKVPPTTTIVQPTDGATVSATTTLDATASDNVSVSTVEFHLINGTNDTVLGTGTPDGTGHWTLNWNTTTVNNGSYTLHSIATDPAANHGQSADINVTIQN
jgi:outer membrane protein assembly factor BamB